MIEENVSLPMVVVGVPTFKRPEGLRRLLESISLTRAPFTLHVVVADNEGENGSGLKVIESMKSAGYPFPLTAIAVPERGISQVRNTLLEVAFKGLKCDYLAMVDDDEHVDPLWIAELYNMHQQTKADVVWGHVLSDFEDTPQNWMSDLAIYHRPKYSDGLVHEKCGTGCVLIARSGICGEGGALLKFDLGFSMTGGEDVEFFTRMETQNNAKFAFTSKAISYEMVPVSRMNKKWAIKRYFRIGASDARIFMLHPPSDFVRGALKEIIRLAGGITLGALMSLMLWSPSRQMRGVSRVARQFGKISGLFGVYGKEYKVTHGT